MVEMSFGGGVVKGGSFIDDAAEERGIEENDGVGSEVLGGEERQNPAEGPSSNEKAVTGPLK